MMPCKARAWVDFQLCHNFLREHAEEQVGGPTLLLDKLVSLSLQLLSIDDVSNNEVKVVEAKVKI